MKGGGAMRTRSHLIRPLLVLSIVALAASACGGDDPGGEAAEQAGSATLADEDAAGDGVEAGPAEQTGGGEGDSGDGELGFDFGEVPVAGPSVIKTAEVDVVVGRGRFDDAFGDATLIAGRYGGFVTSSTESGSRAKRGSLTLRVPAERFEQALADVRGLGDVRSQTISGEDVSADFVDLEARLTTWRSQEAVLLRLMDRATTIEGTLRVQRELQDVQFRIEQIRGQLRVLEDRTALSTIVVGMAERGAPPVSRPAVPSRPSLARAWREAVDGFLGVLYSVVVFLGYAVPILLVAVLAWLGWRRLRPETGVPRAPGGPAVPPEPAA
jgi:hypothetical protein